MALNTYVQQAEARKRAAARVIATAAPPPITEAPDPGPAPFTAGQHVRYDMHPQDVYTVVGCHLRGGTWSAEVTHPYGGYHCWPAATLTVIP